MYIPLTTSNRADERFQSARLQQRQRTHQVFVVRADVPMSRLRLAGAYNNLDGLNIVHSTPERNPGPIASTSASSSSGRPWATAASHRRSRSTSWGTGR
jgi:hypothetical protein